MGIEQFHQLGEIGQGARQAVDLVDDNDIDPVGSNVIEKLLQGRAVGGSLSFPKISSGPGFAL
jgi:hypothetical protein